MTALLFGGGGTGVDGALETTGLATSVMPLVFAVFVASVPEYGAQPA